MGPAVRICTYSDANPYSLFTHVSYAEESLSDPCCVVLETSYSSIYFVPDTMTVVYTYEAVLSRTSQIQALDWLIVNITALINTYTLQRASFFFASYTRTAVVVRLIILRHEYFVLQRLGRGERERLSGTDHSSSTRNFTSRIIFCFSITK